MHLLKEDEEEEDPKVFILVKLKSSLPKFYLFQHVPLVVALPGPFLIHDLSTGL
jgi:hypothetical protein